MPASKRQTRRATPDRTHRRRRSKPRITSVDRLRNLLGEIGAEIRRADGEQRRRLVIDVASCTTQFLRSQLEPESKRGAVRSPDPNRARRPAPVDPLTELREGLRVVDAKFLRASTGEHRRLLAHEALVCVSRFLMTQSIHSTALWRHVEAVNDLFVGITDESLRAGGGPHGKLPGLEKQAHDGMIAAAVKILSEGGPRRGRLTRLVASRTVALELNAAGMRDKGNNFTGSRVRNIFLEVIKLAGKKPPRRQVSNPVEAAKAVVRDRRRRLSWIVYDDVLKIYRKILEKWPDAYTTGGRVAMAKVFVRQMDRAASSAHTFIHRLPSAG
jgi:hypothetical protein